MDLKYTAGPRALAVDGLGRVERGQSVPVDDPDLARRLIAQGWVEVPAAPPVTKTTERTAAPKKEKDLDE